MLGYLNAPSPFSPDGFLDTGDLVEQDGEWLRILGRKSDYQPNFVSGKEPNQRKMRLDQVARRQAGG